MVRIQGECVAHWFPSAVPVKTPTKPSRAEMTLNTASLRTGQPAANNTAKSPADTSKEMTRVNPDHNS